MKLSSLIHPHLLLATILLSLNTNAHAALITETWQSTVTGVNDSAFNIGDAFTWTVTYDNASLIKHVYSDGADGIANLGSNDDLLTATHCTGAAAGGIGCDSNFTSFSLFSDATYDISNFYDVMSDANLTGRDVSNTNYAWVSIRAFDNMEFVNIQSDDFSFGLGLSQTNGFDANGIEFTTSTSYQSVLLSTAGASTSSGSGPVSVPEPSALSLLGIGILGLSFSRRRKHAM
jgi:hypothetical protein